MRPTKEEKDLLGSVAHGVWNEIAFDVMTMLQEQEGKDTIPRSNVLELVCDAGRLEQALERAVHRTSERPEQLTEYEKLLTFVKTVPYSTLLAALRPSFPFRSYGL